MSKEKDLSNAITNALQKNHEIEYCNNWLEVLESPFVIFNTENNQMDWQYFTEEEREHEVQDFHASALIIQNEFQKTIDRLKDLLGQRKETVITELEQMIKPSLDDDNRDNANG
ncbi:hypothetical protein BKI52_02575 [marine bacterium AO1-C]|nr:hypothetical protein BKI52_02575 [marine bacterium AO1-C]